MRALRRAGLGTLCSEEEAGQTGASLGMGPLGSLGQAGPVSLGFTGLLGWGAGGPWPVGSPDPVGPVEMASRSPHTLQPPNCIGSDQEKVHMGRALWGPQHTLGPFLDLAFYLVLCCVVTLYPSPPLHLSPGLPCTLHPAWAWPLTPHLSLPPAEV